jgi:ribosomal protein S12
MAQIAEKGAAPRLHPKLQAKIMTMTPRKRGIVMMTMITVEVQLFLEEIIIMQPKNSNSLVKKCQRVSQI